MWICLVGTYKLNVMVYVGYHEGASNFSTKIPIKLELGVWIFILDACKLNIMVYVKYL